MGKSLQHRWFEMGHAAIHKDLLAEQAVEQFQLVAPHRVSRALGGAIELQTVVKLLALGHDRRALKRHRGDFPAVYLLVDRRRQSVLRRLLQVGRGKGGRSGR